MRYLALTTVFILTAICSMAQNYIKFAEATEMNGRKFFKGEIYQQIADKKILFSGLSWWQYLIGGVLVLIIIFFLYKIIRRFINKRGKYPIYKKYNGGELNEFAEKMGITRSKLIKYNSDLLGDYENLNRKEKDKLKNNLRGKNLIISYSSVYSEPSKPYAEDEPFNQKPQTVTETYQQSQNTNELSSQIQRMESRILNKIESLASNKEASQKNRESAKRD